MMLIGIQCHCLVKIGLCIQHLGLFALFMLSLFKLAQTLTKKIIVQYFLTSLTWNPTSGTGNGKMSKSENCWCL